MTISPLHNRSHPKLTDEPQTFDGWEEELPLGRRRPPADGLEVGWATR